MKFEEFIGFGKTFSPGRTLDLGAISFDTSVIDEGVVRTPHDEMKQAYRMMNNRPLVNSAMSQFTRFVIGTGICFKSPTSESSQEFANKWIEQRTHLRRDTFNGGKLGVGLGNCFFEVCMEQGANGQPWFDNVYVIDDPSRVYENINRTSDEEYWIYEVPTELKYFNHRGTNYKPRYFKINYVAGSHIGRKVVYGIPLHKDKLKHFKFGLSKDGIYGRGFLASALDDDEVVNQIINSTAKIAKYKSIGTKLVSFFSEEGDVRPEDIEKFEENMESRRYEDLILTNKKHQITPLSHVGEYDSMLSELDFFRKEIQSGIVPSFLTPWGGDTKFTNAGEIKIPFQLEISSVQQEYIDFLNELITKPLIAQHGLAEDLTIHLEVVDLETKSEKMVYMLPLFLNNSITLNELRKVAGFELVEEGDKFLYQLPIQMQQQFGMPQGGMSGDASSRSFSLPNAVSPNSHQEHHKDCCGGSASKFQEAFESTDSDETWRRRILKHNQATKRLAQNLTVKKKRNIGGKIIRLAQDAETELFYIYNGAMLLKDFASDERKVATAYFDKQVEKLRALSETFEDGKTREDELVDEMLDKLDKAMAKSVDDFFKELEKAKVKKEAFGLDPEVLKKLKKSFDRFGIAGKAIVAGILAKIFSNIIKPSKDKVAAGEDTIVEEPEILEDLEQAQALMTQRIEDQLDVFKVQKLQDVRRKLIDGVTAGKTHAQIKDDIKKDVSDFKRKDNVFTFELNRIVRTELGGTSNLARLLKWDKQGYEFYEWITMDDNKVRPEHEKRHRKVFKIKDALNGKEIFPGGSLKTGKPNISCRCEARLYI